MQGAVAESAARNKVATKSFLKPGRIDTVSPCGETIYNFVAQAASTAFYPTSRMLARIALRPAGKPTILAMLDKIAGFEFRDGLPQLFLRVHHDRTIPGDWFLDWFPRHQQEPHSLRTRLDA